MKSVLEMQLYNSEGALERVLGRLRQRGFAVCSLNVERSVDSSQLAMHVTVESQRSVENVCRQLEKLFDVQSVKLHYSEASASEGYRYNGKPVRREVCLSV